MSFLSSTGKLNGRWVEGVMGKGGCLPWRADFVTPVPYLTFLKWFWRIINRNESLSFGALTLLSFPITQEELGLRDERTGTEGNLT